LGNETKTIVVMFDGLTSLFTALHPSAAQTLDRPHHLDSVRTGAIKTTGVTSKEYDPVLAGSAYPGWMPSAMLPRVPATLPLKNDLLFIPVILMRALDCFTRKYPISITASGQFLKY
jgi:hypothetical protein